MTAGGVLGFDLSPSLCGWAHVTGHAITAGAFALPEVNPDLGEMGGQFRDHFAILNARFAPARVSYEAPILLSHDNLLTLRCNYGLGMVLEVLARDAGLPCCEENLRSIKKLLADDGFAKKPELARAVDRLGVLLPATIADGRHDAADAVGCALLTLSKSDPEAAAPWLAKLRGSLL